MHESLFSYFSSFANSILVTFVISAKYMLRFFGTNEIITYTIINHFYSFIIHYLFTKNTIVYLKSTKRKCIGYEHHVYQMQRKGGWYTFVM